MTSKLSDALMKQDAALLGGLTEQLGLTGLRQFSGHVSEEFLTRLRAQRGVAVFTEMGSNDPIIGSMLYSIEMLLRPVVWTISAFSDESQDQANAAFIEEVFDDMAHNMASFIGEWMAAPQYGFAPFEIVWKHRRGFNRNPDLSSKFTDGKLGISDLEIRHPSSLVKWIFDDDGNVTAMQQRSAPKFETVTLPAEKMLFFTTLQRKANPEGQAFTLDTLVPTPNGWTDMGTVAVGDMVYGADGKIRYVTEKSEIWKDRPVYEVEFENGEIVVADENHLWSVTTMNDRTSGKGPRIISTADMHEWIHREGRGPMFCAGRAPIVDGPIMELPIPPYVLGYWLGDGSHNSGSIACADYDYEHLKKECERVGFPVSDRDVNGRRCHLKGLKVRLRNLGVLGNKHIPQSYLRSHPSQRLALLQGLMDSDGSTPTEKDKSSRFYNTDKRLVGQVEELVRSLGGKPRTRVCCPAGKVNNTLASNPIVATKDCYEVGFYLKRAVHRLPRKADQQHFMATARCFNRYVQDIRPAGRDDTVCIEVDSPDHLFLVGNSFVPTHNSLLRRAFVPWYRKKNIEKIEAIGIERELAGVPVMKTPPAWWLDTATDDEQRLLALAKKIVKRLRTDEQEGIVMPRIVDSEGHEMFTLELMTTGGSRAIDTGPPKEYYSRQMAMTILADIILLGHEKVGSFALADSKTNLFGHGMGALLDGVQEVFQRELLPRIMILNGLDPARTPTIVHGDIETPDLKGLADYFNKMAGAGMQLFPTKDGKLERFVLRAAGAPESLADDAPARFREATDDRENLARQIEGSSHGPDGASEGEDE